MHFLPLSIKKYSQLVILILILLLGLFLRTFEVKERFEFAHDGDLYSWIVKDIAVNHHIRLVGQLTSAEGIFIGPLFYYFLVPFFLVTNMDPIGVTAAGVIIGILTIYSFYFVLTKLFNKTAGLIAAFLQAVLVYEVGFDRWIVPTLPTKLWAIWYLYTLIMITRGKYVFLPILGILIGLIWHVHIALLPALIALPIAIIASKKKPSTKQVILFILSLTITSLPFILFETRHNFLQTTSLIKNITNPQPGLAGIPKFIKVIEMISKNIDSLLLSPQSLIQPLKLPFTFLLLILNFLLVKKQVLKIKEILVVFCWVIGVVLFFSLSSSPISEYYFSNLEIIFLTTVSLILSLLLKSSKVGFYFVVILLATILLKNLSFYISSHPYIVGYADRKATVEFISEDAKAKGFPCYGITYITRPGENVGFRYFFYLKNQHLVHPSLEVPVYNIAIPDEISLNEVTKKFGHIGIIPPNFIPPKETIEKSCQTPDTNLTDSLFGYVE